MAIIRIEGFTGENRALHPKLLPSKVGAVSLNQKPGRGDLRPWKAPLTVATIQAGKKTIYRMGRDVASDTDYWLSWGSVVHVVRGDNTGDTAERTYYTGDGTPKWTDTAKALGANPPTAYRELGVPAPIAAPTLAQSGGVSTTNETRAYVYTFVTEVGHEGAPSSATGITCKADATVTISGFSAAPSGAFGITLKRIYRTETGSSGATAFYFLREIGIGVSSTTDDGRALGEVLPTTDWLPAPGIEQGGVNNLTEPALHSLTPMWNGMMAGISGRGIRVCEAYVPTAWPLGYEIAPADYSPVALGSFGQTLVGLTNGKPLVVVGGSPDALDEQPIEFLAACVSVRSVVSMGHGVAWASPDGLAYIGSGPARILTADLMTQDDWRAINPSTIIGAMLEGRYVGFYEQPIGTKKGFVIDPANPAGMYFLDFGADAAYVDDLQGTLYVLSGASVRKWDAGAALTATFRSKVFDLGCACSGFACAEVVADAYPVTFRLFIDGSASPMFTATVANRQPFRLPSGYQASAVQIEIITSGAVQAVAMAHSMRELAP